MHPDSANLSAHLDNLKRKGDAGAYRILTQFFFDNALFYRFRDAAVSAGIDILIIPGILPITNFARVVEFCEKCGTSVPTTMAKQFEGLDDDPETRSLIAASTVIQ